MTHDYVRRVLDPDGQPGLLLHLGWPPSVNAYWRNVTINGRARTLISRAGRDYRAEVKRTVHAGLPIAGRVSVVIDAYPPDRRARDIDNLLKSILDSLTHAGVWLDDEQVDDLRIIRRDVVPGGRIVINITEIK